MVSFLLSVPLASAQYYAAGQQSPGLITEGFSFLFGQSSNEIVLKLGLFILLIAVFKAGFAKLKLFEENPNMNMGLGAILSLIAIKFMPVEFSSGLGTLIWVAALFVLPYLLVGMFVENKIWRAVLALLGVAGIYYFISGGIGLYGSRYPYLGFIRGNEIFDDIYYKTTQMGWLVPLLLVAALIFLIYLMRKGGGGGAGGGLMGAWQARQDRKTKEYEASQQRLSAEAAANAQKRQALEERRRATNEAIEQRKAAEAQAEAEKKKAEEERVQANKLARQERLRQGMQAREERKKAEEEAKIAQKEEKQKREQEAKEAKKIRKFEMQEAERKRLHDAEEAEKRRLHELELEKLRQGKEAQQERQGAGRRRIFFRGRQRQGEEKIVGGEKAPAAPHAPMPREEAPEAKEDEDLNKLGPRRTGLFTRIRDKLGWERAPDRSRAPLNVRRMGVNVPSKERDSESTEVDRDMEERMRRVRMQRMRQLQNQQEMSRREEEELQSLITEFNPNQDREQEATEEQDARYRTRFRRQQRARQAQERDMATEPTAFMTTDEKRRLEAERIRRLQAEQTERREMLEEISRKLADTDMEIRATTNPKRQVYLEKRLRPELERRLREAQALDLRQGIAIDEQGRVYPVQVMPKGLLGKLRDAILGPKEQRALPLVVKSEKYQREAMRRFLEEKNRKEKIERFRGIRAGGVAGRKKPEIKRTGTRGNRGGIKRR